MKRLSFFLFLVLTALSLIGANIKSHDGLKEPVLINIVDNTGVLKDSLTLESMDTRSFNITTDGPEIVTLFMVYKDKEGNKNQLYSPVYLEDGDFTTEISIAEIENKIVLSSPIKEQKVFIEYIEFLRNCFNTGPGDQPIQEFLEGFTNKALELQNEVDAPLVKDYLELWGLSSRRSNEKMLERVPAFKKNINGEWNKIEINPDKLINNGALKYFPEFVNLISEIKAPGSTYEEKLSNLKINLPDGELRNNIEKRLISQYIVKFKGVKSENEMINFLELYASEKPELEEWKNQIRDYKSYTKQGDDAPEDIFYDPNGKSITLSDFKGKYIFIDFWASWCVYCIKEMPMLEKIKNDLSSEEIIFIGLSMDENPENWKKAMEKHNISGYQYIVSNQALADKLQINALPRYMLYDKEGKLLNANAPRPHKYEELSQLLRNLD